MNTFQLLFQSKIDSDFALGKVFLSSSDMKRNNWKIGSHVTVSFDNNASGLYVAWPLPTSVPGTAILHQMWNPNMRNDGAKTSKSLKDRVVYISETAPMYAILFCLKLYELILSVNVVIFSDTGSFCLLLLYLLATTSHLPVVQWRMPVQVPHQSVRCCNPLCLYST